METNMPEDLINKLKKEIEKTGFPTELEIGKIFRIKGWDVEHNTYFIDKDENKGREIDLVSNLVFQDESNDHYTEFTFKFIVQIKKEQEKIWVIFTTETTEFERSFYSIFPDRVYNNFNVTVLNSSLRKYNLYLFDRLGRSFTTGFSQGKDNIYSALCNTIKAYNYSLDNVYRDKSTDRLFTYIEPLIVINGQLFEAYLNENSELTLLNSSHLQFRFNYISESYKKRTNGYIINIVTKDYLDEYLKIRYDQFKQIFDENKLVFV